MSNVRPVIAMDIFIDRTAWSRSSQRSDGHYDARAMKYEGMRCKCRRCEASFVFTPEQQQCAYEVEKKYVWWTPSLCEHCQDSFSALSEKVRRFQAQWNTDQSTLKSNRTFLEEWLVSLEAISPYWGSNAMCVSLERRLAELAQHEKDA